MPASGFAGAGWTNPNPSGKGGLFFDEGGDVPNLPQGNNLAKQYPKWNQALGLVDDVMSWGRERYGMPDPSREAGDQEQSAAAGGGINLPGFNATPSSPSGGASQPPPQLMRYLQHADRASPQHVSILEQGAPAQHPADKAVLAIARAAQADPQAGWSVLQHYLAHYDAYRTFAKAALKRGNLPEAAKAATMAHNNLPDGQQTTFQPAQGGIAVSTQPGGVDQGQLGAASSEQAASRGGMIRGYDDGGDVPDPTADTEGLSVARPEQPAGNVSLSDFLPQGGFGTIGKRLSGQGQSKVISPDQFNAVLGASADDAMNQGTNVLLGQVSGGSAGGAGAQEPVSEQPPAGAATPQEPNNDYAAQQADILRQRKALIDDPAANPHGLLRTPSEQAARNAALDKILAGEAAQAGGLQKQELINQGWQTRGQAAAETRGQYENARWAGRNEKDIQVARIKAAAEAAKLQSSNNIRMAHEAWAPFISSIRSGLIQPDQAMEQLRKSGATPEQIQQTFGGFVVMPTPNTQAPQVTTTGPNVNAPPRYVRGPGGGWVEAQ
jgi:hypothetical protein